LSPLCSNIQIHTVYMCMYTRHPVEQLKVELMHRSTPRNTILRYMVCLGRTYTQLAMKTSLTVNQKQSLLWLYYTNRKPSRDRSRILERGGFKYVVHILCVPIVKVYAMIIIQEVGSTNKWGLRLRRGDSPLNRHCLPICGAFATSG
jgi:hypothetical protein